MTTETKQKRNIDYSASAVNLTNPPEIQDLMARLHEAQSNEAEINARIEATIPVELKTALGAVHEILTLAHAEIRTAIDKYGSYQDIINGFYALKQRKVSVSYDAARFEYLYPQYAPAIIVKAVDAAKLKGLIKGGLLNEENLKDPAVGIAKETESFAYIIKG